MIATTFAEVMIYLSVFAWIPLGIWVIYLLTIKGARTVRMGGILFDSALHALNCDGPITGHCDEPGCKYNREG